MTRIDFANGYIAAICIGLGLLLLPPSGLWLAFAALIALDLGHAIAPITAAWAHRGFRREMRRRAAQYIVLPAAALSLATAIGWATSARLTSFNFVLPHQMFQLTDWRNPFPVLIWVYWAWNIWHFGMQNYGVACLCGLPRRRWPYVGMTAAAMVGLPLLVHSFTVFLVMTAIVSVNHWLFELGLTARISGRPLLFLPLMLAAGCVAFLWTVPTPNGPTVRMIPVLLSARAGLGFVHFLYDRWTYRFSDPAVRATIGKAIFA